MTSKQCSESSQNNLLAPESNLPLIKKSNSSICNYSPSTHIGFLVSRVLLQMTLLPPQTSIWSLETPAPYLHHPWGCELLTALWLRRILKPILGSHNKSTSKLPFAEPAVWAPSLPNYNWSMWSVFPFLYPGNLVFLLHLFSNCFWKSSLGFCQKW